LWKDRPQDDRYREAAAEYGAALERLARVYEADPDHRRDLLQEIHLALWRSFAGWDARCSLRTWSIVWPTTPPRLTPCGSAARGPISCSAWKNWTRCQARRRLTPTSGGAQPPSYAVHGLKPLDRQVILSYLEGMDAAAIGEITGLAPATSLPRFTASRAS